MLLGFVGVALLVTPGGAGGAFDRRFVLGAVAIQIGCVGWQYGTSRGKYNLAAVPPLMSAALQALFGGIIVGIAGLAFGELPRFHVTTRTLVALMYLMIFGSVIAFTAYVFAMRSLSMTTLSLYSYVNPVVAVILGWLVLNGRLTWVSFTAIAADRIDLPAALLLDLRLDQPLHRERRLVRVRLRVQRRRRVAGVDAAREIREADVRVAHSQCAGDVAELRDETVGVGVRRRQRRARRDVRLLDPRDFHLRLGEARGGEVRLHAVPVRLRRRLPRVGGLAAAR